MSDHPLVAPSPDAVRGELSRVLASETFANAVRLARFLRYIVERSLAGEGDQLKEYVLGLEVFDRGEEYDPRLDSIVRVEARRLRAKLDEYYKGAGANDPIVIAVPVGTYAPVFEGSDIRRVAKAQRTGRLPLAMAALLAAAMILMISSVAWRSGSASPDVTVAVLPFEQHSGLPEDERLASKLTDSVTSELARLRSVGVVSRTSARQFEGVRRPLREIAQTLNADIIMEGTIETSGDHVKVTPRLVDGILDRKIWVAVFEASRGDTGTVARQIAVAAAEAATHRKSSP